MDSRNAEATNAKGGGSGRSRIGARGRGLWRAAAIAALAALGGCTFLPGGGPTKSAILGNDPNQTIDYAVAELDVAAIVATRTPPSRAFGSDFRAVGPESTETVGVGDLLEVSIWENVEGGLFTSATDRAATIPNLVVAEDGRISVPYIGRVRAAGRKLTEIQNTIRAKLEKQTLKPQVLVSRMALASRMVTVQGDVGQPGVFPLELNQSRLLPVIAAAGGGKSRPDLTEITVRRGEASTSAWLDDIFDDSSANLALRSGDTVIVSLREPYFNAFGAVARKGRVPFRERDTSLLDGISMLGGFDTQTANLTGVFVFRSEDRGMLDQLTRIDEPSEAALTQIAERMPVVYQLRLDRPQAMFLASEFKMREGDTVYVTEAPYAAWRQILSVVIPAVSTAGSVNSFVNTFTD